MKMTNQQIAALLSEVAGKIKALREDSQDARQTKKEQLLRILPVLKKEIVADQDATEDILAKTFMRGFQKPRQRGQTPTDTKSNP